MSHQPGASSLRQDQPSNAPSTYRQRGPFSSNNSKESKPDHRGQKRRFGIAGITNVLITNVVLQSLLSSNQVSVGAATLASQTVNTILGYVIYGKIVFKNKGLRYHQPMLRYLILMIGMWAVNTLGIETSQALSINKNIAAAGLIPILAMLSFLGQRYWVFRE
jgi:putative flippase GtrA